MTNPYTYWNNLLSSPNFCHFSRTFLYTLQLFRHQGVGRSSPGEPTNTKRPIKNIGSFQRVMVISHRKRDKRDTPKKDKNHGSSGALKQKKPGVTKSYHSFDFFCCIQLDEGKPEATWHFQGFGEMMETSPSHGGDFKWLEFSLSPWNKDHGTWTKCGFMFPICQK